MSIREYFGKKLKEIKESKGLSQAALGELVNLQTQTVSQIERGCRAVSFTKLEEMIEKLEIDPSDLFTFEEIQKQPALIKNITKQLSGFDEESLRFIIGFIKEFKNFQNK